MRIRGSGQRDIYAEINLDSQNGDPAGIVYADNRFYVVDSRDDKVYVYTGPRQRVTTASFDLNSQNGDPAGITYANNRFYVVDSPEMIRSMRTRIQYPHDLISFFDLASDNTCSVQVSCMRTTDSMWLILQMIRSMRIRVQGSGMRRQTSTLDSQNDASGLVSRMRTIASMWLIVVMIMSMCTRFLDSGMQTSDFSSG